MTNALKARDITTALSYISPVKREIYQEMWNVLKDQLPAITATQKKLNFIHVRNNRAVYAM
jgi:hypothetical protein